MKTNGYRIFEKNASLRKRTRKGRNGNIALRILSAGLALSMLFTGYGPASVMPLTVPEGVEQVEAALQQDGGDSDALGSTDTVITGFADLPDEIREQTVSPGTTIEELNLPDTLEASVVEKDAENNVGGG